MTAGRNLCWRLTSTLAAASIGFAGSADADLSAQRAAELGQLLRHDCGSCHGLTLKGGLGPPLTPGYLTTKSTAILQAVIRDGIPGTAMPPWRELLSDADIAYLVTLLRRGDEK